ncbi:MAG: TonB-dependent receptor plug domain-containing protein [Flavobacteriales bacterium]|nr:TonB-dependent receptor plug domain-containing protein [Flavobacteriales bacterium]
MSLGLSAQLSSGTLKGKVFDKGSKEPLPFANVVILQGTQQIGGATTDFDGNYTIKPIPPGTYDVKCFFVGYTDRQISGVKINNNKITFLDMDMSSGSVDLEEVIITGYKVPLIDKDGGASGGTVTREDIAKMPGRSALSVATTVGGVSQAGTGGGVSIRGSRTSGTVYFIDGIKVRGSLNLPKSAIAEVQVLTGGIPANVGDVAGGAINISTRSSTIPKFFGGIDIISSGFRVGDDIVGLDAYGQTQIEGSFGGPLAFRKDAEGNKLDPFMGFFVSGNFRKFEDTRPSAIGNWYLKEDVKQDLQANPIRIQSIAGNDFPVYNSDFLRADDFENVKARKNSDLLGVSLATKIDITPSSLVSLSLGGSADYVDRLNYSRLGSVFNYQNNSNTKDLTWRTFVRFTQRFSQDTDEKQTQDSPASIKNAYYTVSVDYSKRFAKTQHERHGEDFFNYGHIGKYETFGETNYTREFNPNGTSFLQEDGFLDTLIQFTPGDLNPDLAQVSSAYFDLLDAEGNYNNFEQIQAGGLLNGDAAPTVYNLFINNAGSALGGDAQNNTYNIVDNAQFRLTAAGSADVGDHAIQIGFEYEQRVDRGYGLAPRGLWNLGRLLTNFHNSEIDFDANPTITYFNNDFYHDYPALISFDDQTAFDKNLRESLGAAEDATLYIDALDPSQLSLDYFSADDLFNGGSSLVNYFGYDHLGNKTTGKPSFDDFFTETDENGFKTRPIGAYEPIYMAGYVMDKFAFDDIIFNVGLRVDRFDANQKVLKDDYVVGEFYTAGEYGDLGEHPGNIGDDYVVYVDDIFNPGQINGYRDGDQWFNAQGVAIDNPAAIRGPQGIAPALINPEETGTNLTSNSFKDYDPAIVVMPRVSFSFPISDQAVFFAHYDVLSQRPTAGNRLNPIDYYFIQSRTNEVNNPNLQPTKTIDYELGFQQELTRTSALKIAAFYREMRDMVTTRFLAQSFPRQYITFRNIDFGTSKGVTLSYDLRQTGNVWLKANYTLQFASGTGSNATSNIDLARTGSPNFRTVIPLDFDQRHALQLTMDYRYGEGKDYNGPVIGNSQILANAGLNIVGNLGSGTPYTQREGASSLTGVGFAGLVGGAPNSARYPWQFTVNAVLDKTMSLNFKKDDKEKASSGNLNVYLLVNNLFNTQNVIGVYSTTGSPDDDGYLVTDLAVQDIDNKNDSESFVNLYNTRLANPFNFSQARTIQLGVRLDF